jgi:hypothetical protein
MNQVEQLQRWGAVHGAAREAERQAAQQGPSAGHPLRERAKKLREQADRLHAEIYGQIGRRAEREGPASARR